MAGQPRGPSANSPSPLSSNPPPRAFHRVPPGQARAKGPYGLQKASSLGLPCMGGGGEKWPDLVQQMRGSWVQALESPWERNLWGSPCLNPIPFPSGGCGEKLGEEVPQRPL